MWLQSYVIPSFYAFNCEEVCSIRHVFFPPIIIIISKMEEETRFGKSFSCERARLMRSMLRIRSSSQRCVLSGVYQDCARTPK